MIWTQLLDASVLMSCGGALVLWTLLSRHASHRVRWFRVLTFLLVALCGVFAMIDWLSFSLGLPTVLAPLPRLLLMAPLLGAMGALVACSMIQSLRSPR